jgi:hypothetical protein
VSVEIITVRNVICDPSQLGDGGVLSPEAELSMREKVFLIDKRCQSDNDDKLK